jgi:hypothetical protein
MTCECGAIQPVSGLLEAPRGALKSPPKVDSERSLQHVNPGGCLGANAGTRARLSILRGRGGSRRHAAPVGFTGGIHMQYDARDLRPVRPFGFGIEQAQIGDAMFSVIDG